MSIAGADIVRSLTGAASDGGAQADPNASLGNYRSSTAFVTATDNNLFDDVTGDEATAGDTEYRCIAIQNKHATLELIDPKVYISVAVNDADCTISFAVETPATANLTNGNAQTIADESTAPTVNTTDHNGVGSGISDWSTAATKATGVPVNQGAHDANLGVDELIFVWVRRVYGAAAGSQSAAVTINIEGDSLA